MAVAATNTQLNIGIRRNFAVLGHRNFEVLGTVLYLCDHDGLMFQGTEIAIGSPCPFDTGGPPATSYSAAALAELEVYWNQGWIKPLT